MKLIPLVTVKTAGYVIIFYGDTVNCGNLVISIILKVSLK